MKIPTTFPVTCHTDFVGPGSTFVAINGTKLDGATFIPQALTKGATKIVVGHDANNLPQIPSHIEVQRVPDTRKALALLAQEANGFPNRKLKIIGITGTAGKTTTTYLIRHILRQSGYKTALLGGVHNFIGDESIPSVLTTQSSDYLYVFLAECVKQGVTHVVMEVSSHALVMDRVLGLQFDAVGFTNLAPEHLDYHKDMDDYFAAKMMIFDMIKSNGVAVVNADDEWGVNAITALGNQIIVKAITNNNPQFTQFICPVLWGEFSKYNVAMASHICQHLGISKDQIQKTLNSFPGVPGRMQLHTLKNGVMAFVDFAHKPSSFEVVLKTLRPLTDHLIVVFGCGGNRDVSKRPVMGKLASELGDMVIITNDNPRFENPDDVIAQIMEGVPENKRSTVIIEKDRALAIQKAVEIAKKGSIIALLGKGHETFYEVEGKRSYFNDFEQISRF